MFGRGRRRDSEAHISLAAETSAFRVDPEGRDD
jgi:hypothetical protein